VGHKFAEIAFTPGVRAVQAAAGSRAHYARLDAGADSHRALGPDEQAFIGSRDSAYLASVTETGWPYVQHRGGQQTEGGQHGRAVRMSRPEASPANRCDHDAGDEAQY